MTILALLVGMTLFLLAAIHVYWAIGGVTGGDFVPSRADGTPLFRPGSFSTLAVALALALAGALVIGRAGLAFSFVPARLLAIGTWGVAAAFAARAIGEFRYVGLFKRERSTAFARLDTLYFTPLCIALACGAALVAWQ